MINITGTLDRGAKDQGLEWKCEAYELAPDGDRYLAILRMEVGRHRTSPAPGPSS